jgi:predicted phosphodiesterase
MILMECYQNVNIIDWIILRGIEVTSVAKNQMGFFSDPHGDYSSVRQTLRSGVAPAYSMFLGDFDLDRPLEVELAGLISAGSNVFWIPGNHDADRLEWHDFAFESELADRNISGRVINLDGLKIAGLGGVFHADVWHPKDGDGQPKFATREDYLAANHKKAWRGGLPLRHRATIFPSDFNTLATLEADVLISHEAPSSHKYGHSEIDDLAEIMGVKLIVHGHIHQRYDAVLNNGIKVAGLEKAGCLMKTFEEMLS